MATMERAIILKRVTSIHSDRFPQIANLELHKVMADVFAKAITVGERHNPEQANIKPGKRCVFFEPVAKKGKSVVFHAYIYTAGLTPDQIVPDFGAATAKISADPIMVGEKKAEVVHRVACLVIGDALIIENARVYGSAELVIRTLRALVRRHSNKQFPRLLLDNAPSRGFKKLVKAHGGVKKVTARVNSDFTPEQKSFGHSLETIFKEKKFTSFKQLTASIDAPETDVLDPDDVLSLVDESEGGTGLSGITVAFADGTALNDLDKYRERHTLTVQEVRTGVPAVTEIETGMVDYLNYLIGADDADARSLDAEGKFLPP